MKCKFSQNPRLDYRNRIVKVNDDNILLFFPMKNLNNDYLYVINIYSERSVNFWNANTELVDLKCIK